MKHRIILLVLCICLLCALPLSANAVLTDDQGPILFVADLADLLTEQEVSSLNNTASSLSGYSGCDVLIATLETMEGYSAEEYAVLLNSGSLWHSDDAVLFLISMEEREWYIATFGSAMETFTDHQIDTLGESAVYYLSRGNYYDGFALYLSMLSDCFQAQGSRTSIGYDSHGQTAAAANGLTKSFFRVLPVSALIGLVTAALVLLLMRSQMNTKRRQNSAADYLITGTYRVRNQQDIFLYSNLSKSPRQQNTGSQSGSGGYRSSGGRSHGGRGGKF